MKLNNLIRKYFMCLPAIFLPNKIISPTFFKIFFRLAENVIRLIARSEHKAEQLQQLEQQKNKFRENQDIRCEVSLACKWFYELCEDESLVPVKDLCIFGDKWRIY